MFPKATRGRAHPVRHCSCVTPCRAAHAQCSCRPDAVLSPSHACPAGVYCGYHPHPRDAGRRHHTVMQLLHSLLRRRQVTPAEMEVVRVATGQGRSIRRPSVSLGSRPEQDQVACGPRQRVAKCLSQTRQQKGTFPSPLLDRKYWLCLKVGCRNRASRHYIFHVSSTIVEDAAPQVCCSTATSVGRLAAEHL